MEAEKSEGAFVALRFKPLRQEQGSDTVEQGIVEFRNAIPHKSILEQKIGSSDCFIRPIDLFPDVSLFIFLIHKGIPSPLISRAILRSLFFKRLNSSSESNKADTGMR